MVRMLWPAMLLHAGLGFKICKWQFIYRPGNSTNMQSQHVLCQADDRGSIKLYRTDEKTNINGVKWEFAVLCQG